MKLFNKVTTLLLFGFAAVIALPATASAASTFQSEDAIVPFSNPAEFLPGAGTLVRDDDSIHVRVTMSGLKKKSAYSAWFIIFNDGLTNHPPDSVQNAGGFLTGTDGTGYFVGELNKGPIPTGGAGGGELTDTSGSEIHIVIQWHGKSLTGSIAGQISIPGSGCNPTCEDQAAILFAPMQP